MLSDQYKQTKNKKQYQNYTDFKIKGYGEYYVRKKAAIGGELFYRLNQNNFYGYSDIIKQKDSLKNYLTINTRLILE